MVVVHLTLFNQRDWVKLIWQVDIPGIFTVLVFTNELVVIPNVVNFALLGVLGNTTPQWVVVVLSKCAVVVKAT